MNDNFKYRVFFSVQTKRANLVSKETKKDFKKSLDYFVLHFNDIEKKILREISRICKFKLNFLKGFCPIV